MEKSADIIGKRFGEVTVLSVAEPTLIGKKETPRKRVNVECSCGKLYIVSVRSLHEHSSCGCVKPSLREKRELVGMVFGRWKVVAESKYKAKNGSYKVDVVCSCGTRATVERGNLLKGNSKSCGCLQRELLAESTRTHGLSDTPSYVSWSGLLYRCNNSLKNYEDVCVCDRWNPVKGGSFENFYEDMGDPPQEKGFSINRIRGAKEYSKENCEWADRSLQGYDQKLSERNKTGRCGVHVTREGKYRAKITKDLDHIILGDFESFEEAVRVREEAELKYYGFTKTEEKSYESR
ncbi:hypothetical protein [Sulfurovum sp.]|uniref:hypothetical protein n=1 Tax=Sulfurovum sp. TaxID=1969726 RepID=UPI00356396FF